MLGLDQQMHTLDANIHQVFNGLNIEPFLRGLSRIVALFDTSQASGRALQQLFEHMFGGASENADTFFIGLEALILKTEIKVLDLERFFQNFGATFDDVGHRIDKSPFHDLKDALESLDKPTADLGLDFLALLNPITGTLNVLGKFEDTIKAVIKAWHDFKAEGIGAAAKDIGQDVSSGFVGGVVNSSAKVTQALKGLGDKAINAFADTLLIHSPSRVFAQMGEQSGEGYAGGVERSRGTVAAAVDQLVQPPKMRETEPAVAGGNSVVVHVNIENVGGNPSEDDLEDLERKLEAIFRRRAEQIAGAKT